MLGRAQCYARTMQSADQCTKMAGRLTGKTALVTAAGAGIGRACALAFAREGATVVATDVDDLALGTLQREDSGIEIIPLDVTDDGACGGIGTRWPHIDVLLNAAGIVHHGTILDCATDQWSRVFDLNVTSMYRTTRAVLPGMIARHGGSIINIASVASSLKGVANRAVYGASKAAVIGLTKSIAVDFVASGIRCNAICPGTVESPSLANRMAASGDEAAARRAFIDRQPMRRLGRPEEIAALAVYLASDESSFTTGTVQIIDGGWLT
jgi:2-keto-3-deoxy-L-fuconate dehydrogenase